jgi:hypothetical protein
MGPIILLELTSAVANLLWKASPSHSSASHSPFTRCMREALAGVSSPSWWGGGSGVAAACSDWKALRALHGLVELSVFFCVWDRTRAAFSEQKTRASSS